MGGRSKQTTIQTTRSDLFSGYIYRSAIDLRSYSAVQPFQPAGVEIERLASLFVRRSTQFCLVVDGNLASAGQGLLFGNVRRRRCTDIPGKGRQPLTHRRWIVVDDVVDSCRSREGGDRGERCVVNVNPRPNTLTLADDGHLLLPYLVRGGLIRVMPGVGTIEKAVAQCDSLDRGVEEPCFEFGIGSRTEPNATDGVHREGFALIPEALARLEEEA